MTHAPDAVRANHAGEFIRRYSPIQSHPTPMPYGQIMPANRFAPISP